MPRNLKEAVNIENAIHIGTAKGYDLFDILTYEAAQEFFNGNSDTRAGQEYVRDETTFNSNINEHQKLYFFAKENTRNVYAGAAIISQASSRITIKSSEGEVELYTNFLFEAHLQKGIIPLFLIPNIRVDGAIGNLIIRNNILEAVLPQLTDEDIIADLDLTKFPQISAIKKGAFDFMPIINLKIGEDVKTVPENAFSNVQSIIVDWIEKPSGWHDSWHGKELEKITYTHQDEIIRRKKEAEEAENRKIEQERQTLIRTLKYRKEGKGITILGITPSFEGTLTIPSTIDNIPVTKIAQLAFYANPNIDKIYLPDSIKEIGKGAFALMNLKEKIKIPLDCKIGKNIFYGTLHNGARYNSIHNSRYN